MAELGAFRYAIFDLFGTLVPEFPRSGFEEMIHGAARVLGADEGAFMEGWYETAHPRQTGGYEGGIAENVRVILDGMGMPAPSDAALADALRPRDEMYRRWFVPRTGALETVEALRERGIPLGLISMCAPDTPAIWRASPFAGRFDVEVFSSEVGLRKPEPAIYRYALERLDAEPAATLYCGDGAYGELTGAEAVGMTAVEIRDPDVDMAEQLRPEGEDWRGARVPDLRDLLAWF
jgi:putative hydrolase of the HAD superfamily